MIEMRLSKVIITDVPTHNVIILQEAHGGRSVQIAIGVYEALAIRRGVREEVYPRPQTHDLLLSVIAGLSARVHHVAVTELKDGTFHGALVLERDGQQIEIDARPSDAVALAVTAKTPIYCSEAVLNAVASDTEPDQSEE